jgi:hypothetical protein
VNVYVGNQPVDWMDSTALKFEGKKFARLTNTVLIYGTKYFQRLGDCRTYLESTAKLPDWLRFPILFDK